MNKPTKSPQPCNPIETSKAQTPRTDPYKGHWATYWHEGVTIFDLAQKLECEHGEMRVELEECKHQNGISARETELEKQLASLKRAGHEYIIQIDREPHDVADLFEAEEAFRKELTK